MILVSIYIYDDRYSALTWRAEDIHPEDASAYARRLMTSNTHYRRVELRLEDHLIAWAERDPAQAAAA